jgi:DNA-binding CsgD family transcriptional regulator
LRKGTIDKLKLLSTLRLPPAAAVPDALALVESLIGGNGSLLLWSNASGDVAGGYSSLIGMEDGLAHYAAEFSNSQRERDFGGTTFEEGLEKGVPAERMVDVLQISMESFRKTDAYQIMMAPYGIENLARVVVMDKGIPRGGLVVFRGPGEPEFGPRELSLLNDIAPVIGTLLRDTADPAVPVIATGRPTHAVFGADTVMHHCSTYFRQHLAMLNQSVPGGSSATRFEASLPESIAARVRKLEHCPRTILCNDAWGRFQLYLDPVDGNAHCSLVSIRMVPINLQMFRSLIREPLSERQLQVACAMAQGDSFHQMASDWQISRHSVITHAAHLYGKLGVSNKDELLNHYVWSRGLDLPSDG